MSRYSPTVLPDGGPAWGEQLAQALLTVDDRKRQQKRDELAQRTADLEYYNKGGRIGTAPVEAPQTLTIPDVPRFGAPDPASLGQALRGGSFMDPGPRTPPPSGSVEGPGGFTGVPSTGGGGWDENLSRALASYGGTSAASPASSPLQMGDQAPQRNKAQLHPGAFDPGTRSFGGSPLQQAVAAQHAAGGGGAGGSSGVASPGRTVALSNTNPRYQAIDEGHYLDTMGTPDARAERVRMDELEFQRALRGEDRADAVQASSSERNRKMQAYIAAGIDPNRAQLYTENPALAANDPKFGKPIPPVLGSPAYLEAKEAEAKITAKYRPPQTGESTVLQGVDQATGQPTYAQYDKVTHQLTPIPFGLKPGAAGGGAAAAKAKTYVDLMQQSFPTMEQLSEKVRPNRISLAVKYPTVGNLGLNQDEQLYMQAARNFLAGVLHQESGARLSNEQWQIGLERFFPTAGDSPETKAAKLASAKQLIADRAREASSGAPGAPAPGTTPPASAPTGVAEPRAHAQQLWDAAVAKHGQAKVIQEFGPRPQ